MIREELEYSISQYLDGSLPPLEKAALEQKLAGDSEAREVLAEYQKLNVLLAQSRITNAPPQLDWERFASQISAVLAEEEVPVRNYSMKWLRYASVAVAACVAVVVGIVVRQSKPATLTAPEQVAVINVVGPRADVATEPAVAEVAIVPPSEGTKTMYRYSQTVVYRPARVVIASGLDSAQDSHDSNGLY